MSGGMSTILPLAGAVVGGVATMSPAGAMAGYSLGSAASGAIEGGEDRSNTSAMLGAQRSQVVGANQGADDSPFATYGDQANPTGQMPSNVQEMNLPQGTEAPGGANKAALTGNDYAGYATTAMQAISAAQKAQQERDIADQALENSRWRNPTVVHGPSMGNVATSMGQFPSVGQGFGRY